MSFTTTVAATRNTGSSKTSLTVTAPSGTGGIIVGFFAASTVSSVTVNATTTVTTLYPPESFSQVFWWPDDGQGSWTFTFASANGPSAILLRVVGEDSSSPIAASSYLFTPSSGYTQPYQTPTTPVSPPDPNSLLVCGWASSQVFTVPADLTAAGNFGSGGWVTLAVGYKTPSGSPTTAEAAPIAGSANADGYQVAIAPAATAATPGAPTGVTAVAGDTDAIVSWTAPASDGGSAITSYTVTATPGGLTQSTANGSTTSLTFTGLTNGTAYTFTVHATNSVGNSAESAASNSVTPTASSFTGTGAVAAPAVTAAGTGTFVPPSFNGSGTVSAAGPACQGPAHSLQSRSLGRARSALRCRSWPGRVRSLSPQSSAPEH